MRGGEGGGHWEGAFPVGDWEGVAGAEGEGLEGGGWGKAEVKQDGNQRTWITHGQRPDGGQCCSRTRAAKAPRYIHGAARSSSVDVSGSPVLV